MCGDFYGFRGNSEHTDLSTEYMKEGYYEPGHAFAGKPWVGFDSMAYKHHRLGIHRSVIENSKHWRLPVIDAEDMKDPGGTLIRYKKSWYPGQERFHTKPLTVRQMTKLRSEGNFTTRYSNRPLGKDKIRLLFKEGAKILGISDYSKFSGHALRANYCTTIANCPGMTTKEKLQATRHASLQANLTYVEPTAAGEKRKLKAFGIEPEEDEKKPAALINPVQNQVKYKK